AKIAGSARPVASVSPSGQTWGGSVRAALGDSAAASSGQPKSAPSSSVPATENVRPPARLRSRCARARRAAGVGAVAVACAERGERSRWLTGPATADRHLRLMVREVARANLPLHVDRPVLEPAPRPVGG